MQKNILYTFLLFILVNLTGFAQSASVITQLGEIDLIRNDSIAFEKLKTMQSIPNLDIKSKLEINHRYVLRAISVQNFGEAVKIANESLDLAHRNHLDSLDAYFNKLLGISYYYMDQKLASIPYFEKAAVIAKKNDFWELEASCYNNIGGALADKQQHEKAEPFLLESIRILTEHGAGEKSAALRSYRVLARLYSENEQADKAKAIYAILIDKARIVKDTVLLASSLIFYSNTLATEGEFSKAIEMGSEGLELVRKGDDAHLLQMALSIQSQNLSFGNRYKEAYPLLEEAMLLLRSNFKKDLEKEVSNMEVMYKTNEIKRDKEVTEERSRKQLLIYLVSTLGSIVLIAFGIYVWNQRKNARQKSLLEHQRLQTLIEGEEKERLRVARDLHDGIVQDLTAIKLKLQNDPTKNNPNLLKELDHAIDEVRSISYRMMPVALKQNGLIPALEDLLRKMSNASNIQCEFESIDTEGKDGNFDPTTRLPEKIELCLYRVAQELLNNVVKHSEATLVTLTLSKQNDKISLFCEDNGKGFDEDIIQKGIGMNGLETRLNLLGGSINFQSPDMGGTLVIASLPLS